MATGRPSNETFMYFSFGSNLLTERIHLNNPTAIKVGIGILKNYRLDFNQKSERWKGAIATIVEDEKSYVYGVIWRINLKDLKNLDQQEEVDRGLYRPLEVEVRTQGGECMKARTYQLTNFDESSDRRPSCIYLNVIVRGAKEHGLPQDYVKKLESIKHNGYKGRVDVKISVPELPAHLCSISTP